MLIEGFRRLRYFSSPRLIHAEKWSAMLAVASFDLIVVGIFLLLYFLFSHGYYSNVEVLIETYRSSSCAASTIAPLPIRASYVPQRTARECLQREVTGLSPRRRALGTRR